MLWHCAGRPFNKILRSWLVAWSVHPLLWHRLFLWHKGLHLPIWTGRFCFLKIVPSRFILMRKAFIPLVPSCGGSDLHTSRRPASQRFHPYQQEGTLSGHRKQVKRGRVKDRKKAFPALLSCHVRVSIRGSLLKRNGNVCLSFKDGNFHVHAAIFQYFFQFFQLGCYDPLHDSFLHT